MRRAQPPCTPATTRGCPTAPLSVRLSIPSYFTDPASGDGVSLETLDELYYKLDLLAVGETLVDFISHELAHSLRTASQFSRYLGGQPANVAVYVAKLGGRSAVITKLGSDYFGEFVEDQLAAPRRRAPRP